MKDKELHPALIVFLIFFAIFSILGLIICICGPEPSYENLLRQI